MQKKKNEATVKKTPRRANAKKEQSLYDSIRKRIGPLGGVTLPEIPREPPRDPPDFSGDEFGRYQD